MKSLVVASVLGLAVLLVACSGPETTGEQSTGQASSTVPPGNSETATLPPAPSATNEAAATATTTPSPTVPPTATLEPTAVPTATSTPEPAFAITSLDLHDIDGEPLRFLSIDEHPYFEGDTLVHGTISVKLPPGASLSNLEVDVLAGESVVASGGLAFDAANIMLGAPAHDGTIAIDQSQLLFLLPSSEMHPPEDDQDRQLTVRVTAHATDGSTASIDYGPVGQLVHYLGDNRYEDRDEARGGDDWLLPSVRSLLNHYDDIVIGDISDMNGGPFPPHVGHQQGNEIDAWFPGYNELDYHTAQQLIEHLNDPDYGSRIELVFVTYEQIDGDPIWEAIRDVTLADGRAARDVIQPYTGHDTHFHWRITPQ